MMADVLLIHPAERTRAFGSMPPLGMGWIAAWLDSGGIDTALVDLQVRAESVADLIAAHRPRIVGIGGTTHTRHQSFAIARAVKTCDERIAVLYGGPHATFTAEDTLTRVPEIDIIVRGEGEISTRSAVEQLLHGQNSLDGIPGLSYRVGREIRHTGAPERVRDLDILPPPMRNPEDMPGYDLKMDFLGVAGTSVMTSRGCPVACSFCSASAMFGSLVTRRSASHVVDEIEVLLKEYDCVGIKIFDSTFTLRRDHVEAICAEIGRRKLDFPWECEIRVGTVDRDLLQTMRRAGCYYVDVGIESASERVLAGIGKKIRLPDAVDTLKWCRELGIRTKVFFTFGHIGETMAEAECTIAFMKRNRRLISLPSPGLGIRIYPGTRVERYAREIGFLDEDFSWVDDYCDPEAEAVGRESDVPILIQPLFGWQQLKRTGRKLMGYWLRDPVAGMRVLRRSLAGGNLARLWTVPRRYLLSSRSARRVPAKPEGTSKRA